MNRTTRSDPSPPEFKVSATDSNGQSGPSARASAEVSQTVSPVEDQAKDDRLSHDAVVSENYDAVVLIKKQQEVS
jgi:hypothetical protein